MKYTAPAALGALGATFFLAMSPAPAQDNPSAGVPVLTAEPAAAATPTQARRWERDHRVSRLVGSPVLDRHGRRLGTLHDLVLDEDGAVTLGVVASGGFLGLGRRLRAVPWEVLQPGRHGARVLSADVAALERLPAFQDRHWPDLSAEHWLEENRRLMGL